jgi:hypothetical protein
MNYNIYEILPYRITTKSVKPFMEHNEKFIYGLMGDHGPAWLKIGITPQLSVNVPHGTL